MTLDEQEKLILALMATAEVMGGEIKPNVALVIVDDLNGYQLVDVLQALTRVRREHTGKLTLKVILDLLAPAGGWISANEAWALALPAADEAATVVWTQEMAKAWAVSKPILDGGDKIGARMAFIPAYERFVDQAKRESRLPHYEISAGWDANMRELAVKNAVSVGLLSMTEQLAALPAPNHPSLQDDQEAENRRQVMSERLKELSNKLRINSEQRWKDHVNTHDAVRQANERRKAEVINQLYENQEKGREMGT
jgi:hypothetical protein